MIASPATTAPWLPIHRMRSFASIEKRLDTYGQLLAGREQLPARGVALFGSEHEHGDLEALDQAPCIPFVPRASPARSPSRALRRAPRTRRGGQADRTAGDVRRRRSRRTRPARPTPHPASSPDAVPPRVPDACLQLPHAAMLVTGTSSLGWGHARACPDVARAEPRDAPAAGVARAEAPRAEALIERLVGMQAQWPSAPYVGIWTRTTSFRPETLERELAGGAVVKATAMRQTLHLVTRRDYALVRAAMSETNFPWETPRRSSSRRRCALADGGPITAAEGGRARRARARPHRHRRAARLARRADPRASHASPRDGALARAAPRGGSSRSRSPRSTIRPRRVPRCSAATSPPSAPPRAGTWSRGRCVPEVQRALDRLEPLRRFRDEQGRAPRRSAGSAPDPTRGRPLASSEVGQRAARVPRSDARASRAVSQEGHPGRTATSRRRSSSTSFVAGTWRPRAGESSSNRSHPLSRTMRREVEDEAGRLEVFLLDWAPTRPAPLIAGAASSRVAGRARRAPLLRLRGRRCPRPLERNLEGRFWQPGLPRFALRPTPPDRDALGLRRSRARGPARRSSRLGEATATVSEAARIKD